ncbi:MAG: acyl-CoA synthetase (AMP-forming)/AMP-acid ligase II [uncultured archaeon A07HB70]|nr:MAG: acyl-CoA synthetase (AMP-forming)/AMP-acid ligase II [uncultured archaeon A07HB70]
MPDEDTIYGAFTATAAAWPARPFLAFEGETVSYETAADRVARRAAFLADAGVGPGDRVGVLSPNDPEFVYLLLATARLGATFVPLDYRQEGSVLAYLLDDAAPTVLVVDDGVVGRYRSLVDDPDADVDVDADRVVVHDAADGRDGAYADAVADAPEAAPAPADVDPLDPAVLSYTSGTTGPPKGVENPHLSYVDAGRRLADACDTDETDRGLLVLPLFHANPTTYGLMQMLAVGGSIAPVREFSASGFFERARATESSFFTHVGSVLEILQRTLDAGEVDPTSPLSFAVGGAAQFGRGRAFERQTGVQLVRLYGLSEVGAGLVTVAPRDPGAAHGTAHQGPVDEGPFEIRLLADDRSFVDEAGGRGEIVVRPERPGLMFRGYRGKPAAVVEAWQDLWMRTGDLGEIRDGALHYLGRERTSIRRMGENVSPWEVESALADWDRVETAVAVGVPDDVAGEVVGLWVVPDDADLTPAAAAERCRDRLAEHLWPRYVGFVEDLPRTSTHKIERAALRDRSFDDAETPTWAADR